ncbi:serine/threonine kinase protein [Gloeomargarita lithophora Alchichica-D10]|uniref:Serine/threonine kinase protein n=1 Tax=Gloeomargarita lithophora Alchichica-D10 TaxID=1188229 RepID=A0A1J0AGF9_9CYAN|nr:serine/threonine kinase protein [Gloeomargarita lithophora Alchichica-D10]
MITLSLMNPAQGTSIRDWSFTEETVIRIGRAPDNEVVLLSSVVSRHHVELRRERAHWEIFSLGANGTFIDGEQVTDQAKLMDGATIRLAASGPIIQVKIDHP